MYSIPTLSLMWAPKGKQPRVQSRTKNRERTSLFGAVDEEGARRYLMMAEKGNTANFLRFLGQLDEAIDQELVVLMVLDKVSFHHARKVTAGFVAQHPRFHFLFLPPYSPALNKQEDEWRAMRREVTHNTYYSEFQEQLSKVQAHFQSLGGVCFKH